MGAAMGAALASGVFISVLHVSTAMKVVRFSQSGRRTMMRAAAQPHMKATATHRLYTALGSTPRGRVASGHTMMRKRLSPPPHFLIHSLAWLRNSSDISQSGTRAAAPWSSASSSMSEMRSSYSFQSKFCGAEKETIEQTMAESTRPVMLPESCGLRVPRVSTSQLSPPQTVPLFSVAATTIQAMIAPMLPTMAPAIAPLALTRLSSTSMAMGHTAQPIMMPMKLYIQPMPMPRFWRSAARAPWRMP
mmetsp:Transcript_19885/g.50280  ORF Transcript_19885/g.50280 Transcript_19885/m.50280 type:complete len:247 (-) Transcript_19885:133-873(-)